MTGQYGPGTGHQTVSVIQCSWLMVGLSERTVWNVHNVPMLELQKSTALGLLHKVEVTLAAAA